MSILWCAHLAGWPRASGDNHFTRRDLVPFAFYGLFLYPLGAALLSSSIVLLTSPAQALNSAFQAFFAKQFGVTVLVLPLVAELSVFTTGTVRAGVGRCF